MNKDNSQIISIGQIKLDSQADGLDLMPDDVPVLPTRNLVLFPDVTLPLGLKRENSLTVARLANERSTPVCLLCQKDPEVDNPTLENDFYREGVIADVIKVIDLPDGSSSAIVHAREHVHILGAGLGVKMPEANISVSVKVLKDRLPKKGDKEFEALAQQVKSTTLGILENTPGSPEDFLFNLRHAEDQQLIINMVASLTPLDPKIKIPMLAKRSVKERGFMLLAELAVAQQYAELTKNIIERTQVSISEIQRNNFLQQQLETIKQELYGDKDDAERFMEKAENVPFSEKAREAFKNEVEKLRRIPPQSADFAVQTTYLDTLLALPWEKYDKENDDFKLAQQTLDDDHYGLEKVKDRIMEQIAVLMNNPGGKAPILCLAGAPGVGKTSLGQSIARAMGRAYARVSLGGLHDEAEIRGHRRTYIGAMPGRIIDALKRAGTSNPVLLLDEVDKIGNDFKGDPAAALLEVLDPEQNCHFHDNYIDIDYDLSKVLFIATANTLNGISQPLLDRMEIIEISGYLIEEKIEIALRHLLPRILKENNLPADWVKIPDVTLRAIIEGYTAESGVRQLEKQLSAIVRKLLRIKLSGERMPETVDLTTLETLLGKPRYNKDRYQGNEYAGVVTGLAWTAVGGEILYIETSLSPGKGDKLTLTGNLGQVMKESATIALEYVKAHASQYGIDPTIFDRYNIHLHVPDGAIPKDGPSAGITMATSIISALRQRRVKARLAMTGEITLRGRVMPVGGIKEKILAAKRSGINEIILCEMNRKDIEEIQPHYLDGLKFYYVTDVREVIDIALTDEPAINALIL